MNRIVHAAYDDSGIYVYQAFTPSIVKNALEKGTFGDGFLLDRMTWIKPSFGWMLHRCGYASKPDQEAVLKIKLSHTGFKTLLHRAVSSTFEPGRFTDKQAWSRALQISSVRYQWDPDRNLKGGRLERRAIQIGIGGSSVRDYVQQWIIGLEDVTELAKAIGHAAQNRHPLDFVVPEEREYPVDEELHKILGMTL